MNEETNKNRKRAVHELLVMCQTGFVIVSLTSLKLKLAHLNSAVSLCRYSLTTIQPRRSLPCLKESGPVTWSRLAAKVLAFVDAEPLLCKEEGFLHSYRNFLHYWIIYKSLIFNKISMLLHCKALTL